MVSAPDADPIRSVDLAGGHRLVVRAADRDDLGAVQDLYGRLSVGDLRRRFFVGRQPSERTTTNWLTVDERGGVALVAEVLEPPG